MHTSANAAGARRARTAFVTAAVLLLSAALVFAKTGRDALFVQGRGLFDVPKAYIGIALLAGPLAGFVLAMLRILGPRTVRIILPAMTALALVWFATVVRPGGGSLMTAFFMFVPLVWGVVFSVSWLLAADLLDGEREDDIAGSFGIIGGGAIGGGVLAGIAGRFLAPHVEAPTFLLIAAGGLLVAAAVMSVAHRRYPPQMAGTGPRADPDDTPVRWLRHPYVRTLLAVGMAAGLVGLLVEFQFYVAAATGGGSVRDQAGFFANFYFVLNAVALIVQVGVVPRAQRRWGIGGSLLVLPLVLVAGAVGLAASASLATAATVRVTEGGLKSSIHRSSWEQTYFSLVQRDRTTAKLIVEGLGVRVAEGFGALVLLAWLHYAVGEGAITGQCRVWLVAFFLLSSLLWVFSTRRLGLQIRGRADARQIHAARLAPLPDG
jgi:AAA family ATP:ADP antiporter